MTDEEYAAVMRKYEAVSRARARLKEIFVQPQLFNPRLAERGSALLTQKATLEELLRRPEVSWADVAFVDNELTAAATVVAARVEYDVKYEGFIERQRQEVARFRHLENIRIPECFDFSLVQALSHEVRQKLERFRPQTLGQAQRISGVTPAAISVLLIALRKYFAAQGQESGA